jgi:hypothetical protein
MNRTKLDDWRLSKEVWLRLFQTYTNPQIKEIIMLTTKTVFAVIATIATVSVSAYAADRQTNPLHPAYYAERVTTEFNVTTTQRYVDAGNPLHPAFAKTTSSAEWVATGVGNIQRYVDARNPLHPAFNRF